MQALYSALTNPISYWMPGPVKVGYTDDHAYKPRIVVTGLKADKLVMQALEKWTTQKSALVNLDELAAQSKEYDLDKDLLVLVIHKPPGKKPIPGFAAWDGPLAQYTQPIFSFKKRVALIVIYPDEKIAEVQEQANLQLPDNLKKQVITTQNFWYNLWKIANQVSIIFKE